MIKRRHARAQAQAHAENGDSATTTGGSTVTLTAPSPLMPLPLLRPLPVPAMKPSPAIAVTPDQDPVAVPDEVAEAVRLAISAIGDAAHGAAAAQPDSGPGTGTDLSRGETTRDASTPSTESARRPGFLRRLFGAAGRG